MKKQISFDIEREGRENNSLIYCLDENNVHKFYNIIQIIDENNFICNPQGKFPYQCDLLKNLDWESIGVFKVGPYSDERVNIHRKDIEGKVLHIDNFFITCPNNVLREQ